MGFDRNCRKALFQMRDSLKDIDQKISHLIEQGISERRIQFDNLKIRDEDD